MDKIYMTSIVQKIIDKTFHDSSIKRKIITYDSRINFRCPYCLEGKTPSKKRCNLYWDKALVICFRCDKKTSFDKLCKDFNEQIDPDQKLKIIEHLSQNVTYDDYQDNFVDAKFDDLIDFSQLEESINKKNMAPITNFEPIRKGGGIFKYLIGRGIPEEFHKNIFQARFWKTEDQFEHVVCFLNRRGDKIIGVQIRNLKEGKKRLFKIYNFENIYKWVHGEDKEFEDMSKFVVYNKLSYFFNILNVDFGQVITIFEGYIDSLFYPNSIGIVGVNTDTKFLENNNLEIQFFFDNDEAGFKKSEEKLKQGFKIFLWKKLFESIINSKKSEDPHQLEYRINKVKDLNKLAQLVPNPTRKLNLPLYFSQDVMDVKYLPKYKWKRRNTTEEKDYNKEFNRLNWN